MMTQQNPEVQRIVRNREALLRVRRGEEKRMINPDRPAADVLPDGAWRGQPCFIIGGGPSLIGFDFERLRGRGRIIVINKGFEHVPFADVLFFMDHAAFYMKMKRGIFGEGLIKAWDSFPGIRVFLNLRGRDVQDAYSIKSIGRTGIPTSIRRGIYHGNNSGYGAIGLALCLAADPIYLLGYDAGYEGSQSHWHGGYGWRNTQETFQRFGAEIDRLGNAIAQKTSTRVINLNPLSGLRAFAKKSVDEVLR
jgi:hypothetical protein